MRTFLVTMAANTPKLIPMSIDPRETLMKVESIFPAWSQVIDSSCISGIRSNDWNSTMATASFSTLSPGARNAGNYSSILAREYMEAGSTGLIGLSRFVARCLGHLQKRDGMVRGRWVPRVIEREGRAGGKGGEERFVPKTKQYSCGSTLRDPSTARVATGSVADMSDPNFIASIGLVALSPDIRPF
jgi:hypothetical protein